MNNQKNNQFIKTPLFSIIVPVYKVEDYISECIDSLLNQDYKDYEIILVDDGSPDRCPDICDLYKKKNNQVRVIHKINGGLSDARNAGIQIATGKYITFVDSDDFWIYSDVLSGIATIIETYHPDIILSDFIKYYSNNNTYIFPRSLSDENLNGKTKCDILKYLYFELADLRIAAWQKFVKREFLENHIFTKDLLSEDIDWSISLYTSVKSICLYPKTFYCYRQMREGSITNKPSQRLFDSEYYIINKWKNKIPKLNISKEEQEIFLGYLAYQLSVMMISLPYLAKNKYNDAYKQIKNNLDLFNYPLNEKTQKVRLLLNLFGIKTSSWILSKYIRLRNKKQSNKKNNFKRWLTNY